MIREIQSERDEAYAYLDRCKNQFIQVQKCLESYKKETKKFK